MYKLFYSPGACSLAVHILLEELDVPYELEEVSVKKGRTESPEYRSINGKGRVPALQAGGDVLTEAPAILMYLAAKHPEKALLPKHPLEHFRCLEWFNWLSGTVHAVGYGQFWRPARFIDDPGQHKHVSEKGRQNILESYASIDRQLADRTWPVGRQYCCVDPFLLVFYLWGNLLGIPMRREFPAWSSHTDRVVEREAVSQVLKDEGLPHWLCVKPISSTLAGLAGKFSA